MLFNRVLIHLERYSCECRPCVCAACLCQLGLAMTSMTHGATSLARATGGTAYQLLQITTGSYIVVLEVDVVHKSTGMPYGVCACRELCEAAFDMCVFDSCQLSGMPCRTWPISKSRRTQDIWVRSWTTTFVWASGCSRRPTVRRWMRRATCSANYFGRLNECGSRRCGAFRRLELDM